MAKGSQPAPTTTTSYTPSPQETELQNLVLGGVRPWAASVPQRYTGETIAPFTASEQAGQQAALGAVGAQQGTADAATRAHATLLDNPWDVTRNDMLQKAITAGSRGIQDQLTQQLAQIRSGAQGANYGSSRQGVAEGLASQGASNAIGDVGAKLAQSTYDTNMKAMLSALGLTPTVQGAQVQPAITQSGVGETQRSLAQAGLTKAEQEFYAGRDAPLNQAAGLAAFLPAFHQGTTTSVGSNPPQPNPALQSLGGAASGAALGSAIFPGVGTAAGAGLGALLPFLLR